MHKKSFYTLCKNRIKPFDFGKICVLNKNALSTDLFLK